MLDAGKRRTKKNYVKACRRQSDDKSDDKKLMRIAKALILLTFLRVGFKTLTPYVRVRILLPLPDIGLNRYDSSRFSLFSASFRSKKFRAKKLYPYRTLTAMKIARKNGINTGLFGIGVVIFRGFAARTLPFGLHWPSSWHRRHARIRQG